MRLCIYIYYLYIHVYISQEVSYIVESLLPVE